MSVRAWVARRWPRPDDILVADVEGSTLRLRAFLREHSVELGRVVRRGERTSFRAFVAAGLLEELRKHAHRAEVVLNASNQSRTMHQPVLASARNRFADGQLPPGVGHGAPDAAEDYWSLDEVDSALAGLQQAYPQLSSLIELPEATAGDQRACWALRVGRPSALPKHVLVVLGGMHGAEWGSCESAVGFATDLLASTLPGAGDFHYGQLTFTAAQLDSILARMDVVVFPLVNPDGRLYSRQFPGTLWRKNRSTAHSGGQAAAIGVDLNRNFGFLHDFANAFDASLFGFGVASATETNYCGPKPFSEPESRNVRWLLDSLPRARWLIDVHSPWQTVLHPWGDDDVQSDDPDMTFRNSDYDSVRGIPDDRMPGGNSGYAEYMTAADQAEHDRLAGRIAAAMQGVGNRPHPHWPGFAIGTFFGTCIDYAFSRHEADPSASQIHAFLVEWGDGLIVDPPWPTMRGTYMPEVVAGLVQFCLDA